MHTGAIFLFPHIFKVTWTAENVCKNMAFDSRMNIWARMPAAEYFACEPGIPEGVRWSCVTRTTTR